jgi:hypothetical protein
MDLLQPEYNILQTAGSRLGIKLSPGTKAKIAVGWTKEELSYQNETKQRAIQWSKKST